MITARSFVRSSAGALSLVASLSLFAGCMRAPDASPLVSRAETARVEAPRIAPAPVVPAPITEQKPTAGTTVTVTVAPTQSDVASVTIVVTATRAVRDAKLRIGTELPARVEGEGEFDLPPLAEGASFTKTVTVRRTQPSTTGSLVSASVVIERDGTRVSDVGAAWAFGEPSADRVLPRSGATLGEDGTGQLGPNDRVIRTPEGVRLHESIVP